MRILQLIALAFVALAARADTIFGASVDSTYSILDCCDDFMRWSTDGSTVRMGDNGHDVVNLDRAIGAGLYLSTGPLTSYDPTTSTYVFDSGVFSVGANGGNTNAGSPMLPGYECVPAASGGCVITPGVIMQMGGSLVGDVVVKTGRSGDDPGLLFLESVTASVIFTVDPTLVAYGGLPSDTFIGSLDGDSSGIRVIGTAVPEPSALLLLATAMVALWRRRHIEVRPRPCR